MFYETILILIYPVKSKYYVQPFIMCFCYFELAFSLGYKERLVTCKRIPRRTACTAKSSKLIISFSLEKRFQSQCYVSVCSASKNLLKEYVQIGTK